MRPWSAVFTRGDPRNIVGAYHWGTVQELHMLGGWSRTSSTRSRTPSTGFRRKWTRWIGRRPTPSYLTGWRSSDSLKIRVRTFEGSASCRPFLVWVIRTWIIGQAADFMLYSVYSLKFLPHIPMTISEYAFFLTNRELRIILLSINYPCSFDSGRGASWETLRPLLF